MRTILLWLVSSLFAVSRTAAPGRAGPRMKAVLTLYLRVSSLFAVSRTAAPGRAGPRMKAVLTLYLGVSSLFAVSRTAAPGRAGPRMKAVSISTSEISSSLPLNLTLRRVESVGFSGVLTCVILFHMLVEVVSEITTMQYKPHGSSCDFVRQRYDNVNHMTECVVMVA